MNIQTNEPFPSYAYIGDSAGSKTFKNPVLTI